MSNNIFYSTINNFDCMQDNELIVSARSGNKDAINFLISKYENLVTMKVGKYFIIGAEKEDIIQEGMIGLFKAIKDFDANKQNSFKSFANLCIERQLITAIKSSNRQKHIPLNSYISLNNSAYDNEEDTEIIDIFDSHSIEDPLDTITRKEYYKYVEDTIAQELSSFEKKVLHRYIQGESYVTIADKLNSPVKSIDNAIQRIRKKTVKGFLNKSDSL